MTDEYKIDLNSSEGGVHYTDPTTLNSEFLSSSQFLSSKRKFKSLTTESATETSKTNSDWQLYSWSEMKHGRRIPFIRKNHCRLRAGGAEKDLFMRPTLFQRGVSKKKQPDFAKDDLPTNWGLYKGKQETWQSDNDFAAHPTTTYSREFKWWGKQSEPDVDTPKQSSPKTNVVPVKEETAKDWNVRGHRVDLLPIPWQPPEPRWPNDMARSAHAKPDLLRWREINARLARTNYEVQHPTEKWASNLYLN